MLLGTLILIIAEVKHKRNDKRVKLTGAVITMIAMMAFLVKYNQFGDIASLLIASVTTAYWAIVSVLLVLRK